MPSAQWGALVRNAADAVLESGSTSTLRPVQGDSLVRDDDNDESEDDSEISTGAVQLEEANVFHQHANPHFGEDVGTGNSHSEITPAPAPDPSSAARPSIVQHSYPAWTENFLMTLGVPRDLGPHVIQFGFMTRVWGVEYTSTQNDDEVKVSRRLGPYESQRVPDVFLVMMT